MKQKIELSTPFQIKVFSDVYRMEIFGTFKDLNKPSTVKEVADHMKQTPAKVYYHVKKMVQANMLKLVYTKEINGIVAKYYEPTAEDFVIKGSALAVKSANTNFTALVNKIYDTSKANFFKNISNNINEIANKSDNQHAGHISLSSIYLTREEFDELSEKVKNFCNDKGEQDKAKKDSKRYEMLVTCYECSEENSIASFNKAKSKNKK